MSKVMIEMEMPKSCAKCRFLYVECGVNLCKIKPIKGGLSRFLNSNDRRYHTCPLQEVKE